MNIREYKITYKIFNFFKKKQLEHNIPHYKKHGLKKKYYSSISSVDFEGIDSELNIYDRNDSRQEMFNDKGFNSLEESLKEPLLSWSEKGYVILKNFFSEEEVDSCNASIQNLIESKKVKFRYINKVMFAIHHSEVIKNMGIDKRLLTVLNTLLGKKVQLFQSINFLQGSQQRTHSDSIHMTTFPYGNLIAVWIALEDIEANSGPLHYYPGSHKLPYVMNRQFDNIGTKYKLGDKSYVDYENHIEEVIEKNNFEKEVFLAKKGDILIWHANLLHGGEEVIDKKSSRKSMVFHYYTDDAICFHEVTQRPALKKELK